MDRMFKVVVCGPGAVGKTALCHRFETGKFEEDYWPTVGCSIYVLNIEIRGVDVRLVVWDLAGQSRYDPLRSSYYSNAHALILVYDVSREATATAAGHYFTSELSSLLGIRCFILVGNKTDIKPLVSFASGLEALIIKSYPKRFLHILTSAKKNENVQTLFRETAECLLGSSHINAQQSGSMW